MSIRQKLIGALAFIILVVSVGASEFYAQGNYHDEMHKSARSDKFTGGRIEKTELEAGQPDIKITVNVPAFQLTLWQNGKEVKTYPIGVGQKEFPIYIGMREATEIIWNPAWIPPQSGWVHEHRGVAPGEVIKPGDPRNPLGKLKIPLGGGYLIHQAEKPTDLGHLVSHGCVRMLRADLYDLAEKIAAARDLPVSKKQIAHAKETHKTLAVKLDPPLPVDINYDTQVVEGGRLHLYPDIYDHGDNTVEHLRAELQDNGIDASQLDDETLSQMIARVSRSEEYVVSLRSIAEGHALTDGETQPIIWQATKKQTTARKHRNATALRPQIER